MSVSFVPRCLDLPGGRALVIRPMAPADASGLVALYASLTEDDLYRRFFQAHAPAPKTVDVMVQGAERGGFGLVAVARAAGVSKQRVVAECGYEVLPNGNGELGITVAPGWRGWLGPYLLDALLDAAAARGVPNLEADILVENRPMFAMVSARGYATVDHYEQPAIVRVVLGAQDRSPCWPRARDRPRVLIEAPGGRWHGEGAARAAGLEVLVCPGPLRARARCPALAGEVCPLAAGADVIVDAVSLDEEAGRALLESHQRLHGAVPVCVEQPPEAPEIHGVSRIPLGADETVVVGLLQRFTGAPVTDQPHAEG